MRAMSSLCNAFLGQYFVLYFYMILHHFPISGGPSAGAPTDPRNEGGHRSGLALHPCYSFLPAQWCSRPPSLQGAAAQLFSSEWGHTTVLAQQVAGGAAVQGKTLKRM